MAAADEETLTTTGDGLRGVASTGLATNVTTPAGDIGLPTGRDDLSGLAEVDARSYVFGAAIARGGMGIIRSARDRRLGREVAIKELLIRTPSLIRRFEREARITARLEHPGIVSVHEAGRWRNGEPFFAMRKVAGIPLDQAVERCHSVEERLPLVAHVLAAADALAYAHSLRVIHRDLKPANVLVGSFGETVVIDWGLAKELDRDEGTPAPPESAGPSDGSGEPDRADLADAAPAAGATAIGTILGTPSYMAPEQARAEAVDERADVHALGAMLYHVLAGRRPYDGSAHAEILAAVLDGPPPPLASRQPGLPRELVAIVERAMAYAPADRYPRAQEMADDLRRYQAGQLVGAHRYTAGELVRRWIRRHRAAVAVAALAAVALITVGVVSLRQVVAEKRAAEAQRRAAEATASALLVEQGRQEYLAGRPGRALVYLSAAYQRGQRDVAVRTLLNRALPSVEAQERVVEAHAGTVSSAAFSPDGERVVTAGTDGKARIWSRDGRLLASLAHHGGAVVAALSPDGARLATASSSGEVRLWDARSGALLRELAGHTGPISMIDWSGDGTRFATSSHDGTTRVWDPESGVATMVLGSGKSMATSVHFVPGRPRLVTGDRDGVHLWDLATGREVAPLPYSLGQPIVSPDGRLMATVSVDRMIETFDTETGAAQARWQVGNWSDEAKRALFTTSGYLVTFGEGAGATLWRPDGMLASDMVGHSAQIVAMAASRDGNLLATGSLDRTARIWIVGRRDPVAVLDGHGGSVRAVAFSPDGSRLVTGADDGTLRFWRVPATGGSRGQPTRPVGDRVVLDATGTLMAACTGNRLVVREVATGVERASIPGNPWMLRFSPDGRWLAAADKLGAVRLLDTATWSVARTLATGSQQIYELAFAPAGDRLLVIRPGVPSEIWDTETGTRRVTLAGGGAGYDADQVADFSPDGKQVATIDARGLITLWDAATGQPQHRLRGHTDAGAALIYSADGRRLVSGGLDTTARVWDLSNGALISVLQGGHTRSVNVIRLSPDGALAVTGGTDRIILLWDIETGRLLSQLQLSASMFDGHFGADGALITADNHIWTWDLRPEARSPEVIAAIVAARVPWRLRDGRLVSVTVPEAR